MLNKARFGLVALAMVALPGCAVKDGWQGAAAEKAYDKDLDARRLAEELNNDDYWEIYKDGRIYVLTDLKGYQTWLKTDEIPLVVTKVAAGPNGETLKLGLIKDEAKLMETKVGAKGAAQKMFEGELKGLEKGFYGEVQKDGTVYVFADWVELVAFKRSGAASGETQNGAGPNGANVTFVGKAANAETKAKFANVYKK